MTLDNLGNSYTYDAEGRPLTAAGVQTYYDAFNRAVSQNRNGAYTQIVYAPSGQKFALMNGWYVQKYFVPLAAGLQAVYNGSGLQYYRHSDWEGNSRFAATSTGSMYYDAAYAPFGENYAETGTTDRSFTGQTQDTTPGLYDFLLRQQSSSQGRWLAPDPAGLAAVDATNPQTWNRYAYVGNNPLSFVDPLGLCGEPDKWDPSTNTLTGSVPCPPSWFYLAWLGWPGRGSMQSLFCMVMGGCGGSSGSSGGGGGGGQPLPPTPKPPKPPFIAARPVKPCDVSGNRHHGEAIDIRTGHQYGQPVFATEDGIVRAAFADGYGSPWPGPQAPANSTDYVLLSTYSGNSVKYVHVSPILQVGSLVYAGDQIGYNDRTGRQDGPHVHMQVEVNGNRFDPSVYLWSSCEGG